MRSYSGCAGVQPLLIEPGGSWGNGYVESFNGKLGDELLIGMIFETDWQVAVFIETLAARAINCRHPRGLGT